MLKHLNNLFLNPAIAWREIEKEYYVNKWAIIKQNLSLYFIINPFLSAILHIGSIVQWKKYILNFIFFPAGFTFICIIIIMIISIIIEEIYKISSFRDPQQNIFKLMVFSSLPFFSTMGLTSIPFFGKILFITGVIYSLYIFKVGFDKYIWVHKSSRRQVFVISSAIAVMIFFIGSLFLVTTFQYLKTIIVKKVF